MNSACWKSLLIRESRGNVSRDPSFLIVLSRREMNRFHNVIMYWDIFHFWCYFYRVPISELSRTSFLKLCFIINYIASIYELDIDKLCDAVKYDNLNSTQVNYVKRVDNCVGLHIFDAWLDYHIRYNKSRNVWEPFTTHPVSYNESFSPSYVFAIRYYNANLQR